MKAKVADAQCATCIFRPGSGFDLAKLRERWKGGNKHQTCHAWRIAGERGKPDVWCRGFWENEIPDAVRRFALAADLVEWIPQKKR